MDLAGELRKASQAARGLEKYLPAFQAVLLGFPQATLPAMRQNFYWAKYNIQGKPTYVLTHILAASDGAARAVVQRQYYVSTGYNAEQAVAGFLPVQGEPSSSTRATRSPTRWRALAAPSSVASGAASWPTR